MRGRSVVRVGAAVEAIGQVVDNGAMDERTPKNRWAGVDRYLTALYGRPMESTDLLRGLGFGDASIATLRLAHQEDFAERIVAGLHAQFLDSRNGERLFFVVTHFYGLDGETPWLAEEIAAALKITPTRVRQIRTRAMRRHKSAPEVARLEEILQQAADGCLAEA